MVYSVTIDFNCFFDRLNDCWGTRLLLPNGAVIKFWNCMIKYVNSNDTHYLSINSDQKQNIKECLILISFFTTLPLSALEFKFEEIDEISVQKQLENSSVTEWIEKLSKIENSLRRRGNNKHRDEILSLMQMCSIGALHEYSDHHEEQFFMYFKPIERVAKLKLDKAKILTGSSSKARKEKTKKFLKDLFESNFNNTVFDQVSIDQLAGKLNSTLENSLERKNHRRIVLALSSITNNLNNDNSTKVKLRKISSDKVKQLVEIRNDIAHGNKVIVKSENLGVDYLGEVEYLSRQFITLTFLDVNFEQVYLNSKKFGEDFWGDKL
jgi:hypothetical protein